MLSISTNYFHLLCVEFPERRPVNKPLTSEKNRRTKVDFAKRYLNKMMNHWKKALFSDVSLFGSHYVRILGSIIKA